MFLNIILTLGILPVMYFGYSKPQNLTQPFSQTHTSEMFWYSENINYPLLYQGLVMPTYREEYCATIQPDYQDTCY